MNSTTLQRCVIFGNPIAQSKSPEMQVQFAHNVGVNLEYLKVLTPLDDFAGTLEHWINQGIVGANITVPFKEEIYRLCDDLTPEARTAKAVNTIRIQERKIYGHNTDGIGLIRDMTEIKGIQIASKRVLVLGAGGAVRGIMQPLLDQNPYSVTIANRTFIKAEQLVQEFANSTQCDISAVAWHDLQGEFDLIINGTSASLQQDFPALPQGTIGSRTIGYDLVYSNQPTIFMEYIYDNGGKKAYDGLGMLIEQGVYAFEFWFGKKPSIEGVMAIFGR